MNKTERNTMNVRAMRARDKMPAGCIDALKEARITRDHEQQNKVFSEVAERFGIIEDTQNWWTLIDEWNLLLPRG